ncbi:MAG TPA: hypothetical protein VI895_05810 [Bdellovibrionota bacterium]|nr:hypothetical protein [Bdellovibrionota bacterium]
MKPGAIPLALMTCVGLFGCAGGGVDASGTGASSVKFASAAPVEFLPYEILRNNIVQNFQLSTSSSCIKSLDSQKELYGSQAAGGARSLNFSITRAKSTVALADLCCREALQKNEELLLDENDPLNFDKLGRAIFGRPLTDSDRQMLDDLGQVKGYTSNTQRQHAACVTMFASLKATVQ